MPLTRRLLLAALPTVSFAGCSPLQVFNAVSPRDAGPVLAVRDAAYGPHPRQRVDLYAPPPGGTRPVPLAVFFYGGSWKGGRKEEYAFAAAALAAAGFAVAVPDYRLYPEVRFPDFLADCAEAVRWAVERASSIGADPGRVVLAGHSAGAYNAAMLALDARYLARAGVSRGAVRAWAGLSGPYDFLPLDPGTAREVFGGAPDLRATQPITFASRSAPPAFLATGADDDTVRPKNTTSLAARLTAFGVPLESHLYPGLDHADTLLALSVPFRGKAPEYAAMTAFLRARAAA